MSVVDFLDQCDVMADDANQCARLMFGRDINSMSDVDWFTKAYVKRSVMRGLPPDSNLDSRMAWQSVACALWKRCGGTRFCPSDSVAASFVLTKQQPGKIHLPFPAQIIQIPKGFMPSPVLGEYEGLMLVARLSESMIYVINNVERGNSSGNRVMFFADDIDESEAKKITLADGAMVPPGMTQTASDSRTGIAPSSQRASEQAAAMTVRIIRNFASWVSAFPIATSKDNRASLTAGSVGGSMQLGKMVYLKTEVQIQKEMRDAAKSLVRMDADHDVRKLAMRHIVRGHWKRQVIKDGRKTIWVAPYWRGPDGPEAWGRVYKMREERAS